MNNKNNNVTKACVAIVIALASKRRVKKRKIWTKCWLQDRDKYTHLNLLKQIQLYKEMDDFENYFRMSDACFENLLEAVTPFLTKKDTVMRKSISAREKLALTLHYLASGRYFKNIRFSAIMSPESVSQTIMDTCDAIRFVLRDYIKLPSTQEQWKEIANDFGKLHHFYNCFGALDGKHVKIKHPPQSGSLYYNYKGYHSIVLMALVNAKKEFIMIDIGSNGRVSDGGVLFYTKFWQLFQQNQLNLPIPSPLPNSTISFPYVIVADEAFALSPHLMKPYSQRTCTTEQEVFNIRLSKARQVVECAFGILNSKFEIFHKAIALSPDKASKVTAMCCYLHNYLLNKEPHVYLSTTSKTTADNNHLDDMATTMSRNSSTNAKNIRDNFCQYFNNEGKL